MSVRGSSVLTLLGIICLALLFSVSNGRRRDERYPGEDEENEQPQRFFGSHHRDRYEMGRPGFQDINDDLDYNAYDYDNGEDQDSDRGSHHGSRHESHHGSRHESHQGSHHESHHGSRHGSRHESHHGLHHESRHGSRHRSRHRSRHHHSMEERHGHHSSRHHDDDDDDDDDDDHRGHHGDNGHHGHRGHNGHHGMRHHSRHHRKHHGRRSGMHHDRDYNEYGRWSGMRGMDKGHHCYHNYDYHPIPPPPYDRDFLPDEYEDPEEINDFAPSRRQRRRRRRNMGFNKSKKQSRIRFLFTNIGGKNWWEGPNVCKTKTQDINNVTESDIQRHNIMYSKACDQSETIVKCTTTIVENGEKLIETEVLECCAGWSRKRGDFGCTIEIELVNLVELLEKEGLTEFLSSARAMGLEKELSQENVTVFVPLNSGFVQDGEAILPKLTEPGKDFPLTNVVIVSKPSAIKYMDDIRSLILSHMVPEVMKSSNMFDDQLIPTGSPFKSSIRVNFYNHPVKMMTANCVKVTSPNLQATNGVVHVVERIINPVSDSLLDQITSHPELSFLKGVIGKVGFVQMLDEDGQMTVFAPTNAAFKKLDKKILAKLTNEQDECSQMILKNHILPNIICSAPIQGHVRSPNLLGQHVKLHRDEDGKLFVNNAQIVVRDIMTTNGVLYLIDEVLVPDGAKTFLEIAEIENADHFVQLVDKARLTNELNDLKNVTVFLPTNEATQALMNKYPHESVKKGDGLEELKTILRYHIALGALTPKRFYNDKVIDTMLKDNRKLRINEYSMFSFDSTWTHTVQCARISSRPIQTCNGVTYLVDKVLTPPEQDIMHMLSLDKRLTTFVHLLKKSGMADKIVNHKSPLTIFAPTNNAFQKLSTRERERWEKDEDAMSSYISESTMCCASLHQGSGWFSRSWRSRPSFHGANIISCDNMATNGVIHITDGVIVSRKRSPQYMGFFDLRNLFM